MEAKLGYLMKTINDRMKREADHNLQENGITLSQSRVMSWLHFHGNTATQKELELGLEVSHPTVVGLVKRMEKKGFLTISIDPNDKRNRLLTLTPEAEKIGEDMNKVITGQEEKMMKGLTDSQRKELISYLTTVYTNLR